MKNIPRISAFTVIVAFVAVSLVGLAVIPSLTIKLVPSRSLPSLTVNFSMQGNSARIVEMEVTSKLEAMLARIEGVKNIHSTSGNNFGRIRMEIDKHASMDMVRLEASTIIRQTWPNLPPSAGYPTISVNRPDEQLTGPFLVYTIDATVQPIIIQQYAETNIKPLLSSIPDLYGVEITGATPMEWILEYDVLQLDALGISPVTISEAISRYNQKEALGMVMTENSTFDKRYMRLSISSENEHARKGFNADEIFLPDRDGNLIRLDKLVTVTYREAIPSSYFRINGLNSIYLSLTAAENANQIRLSQTVKAEIAKIKQMLPHGYEMRVNRDATEYIHTELNKIYIRTVFTIFILLLFVFLTTFNARYLLLIVLSLYFNISIAFIFYYLFDLEIQIYSLAGITISLSLVIDNTIIMADHYMRNRDLKAFLSILAATITSVGALSMIFFLNENMRLNLQDFATVVIINLLVSLVVSLCFVPSTIEKLNIKKNHFRLRSKRFHFSPKRIIIRFNRMYVRIIRFLFRYRTVTFIILLLAFGLPVFMIPDKINSDSKWAERYNKVVTSAGFKDKVRPIIEKSLGGTLRLFVQKVYNGSYFKRNEEMNIRINASMPNGTTIQQMNRLIQQMESYLSEFNQIRQFQTRISNPRNAEIQVYFTKEAEKTGFPYQLKSNVISQALQLGGGSWGVYGLDPQGFSNNVSESAGNMHVRFYGYNYDDLYEHTEKFKEHLLTNYRRIKDVLINSQYSYYKDDYVEFVFSLDRQRMAAENLRPYELYASLSPVFMRDRYVGRMVGEEQSEAIKMSSRQSRLYDLWSLAHLSRSINGKYYKTSDIATITQAQTPQNIIKENQQYVLSLQYDYVGAYQQANKRLDIDLEKFNKELPMGYSAERAGSGYSWTRSDNKQYLFLALIIVIIIFMTSILFNSLKQPLAIIFIIPVSYIGVFLTFYLFKLNFDPGGFASFVLLCAITINASIYLINEYNRIRRRKPLITPVRAYIKAWNIKIVPIFLTIISTVLGFIPFMVGLDRESFWFPLAAGTIGGLIMSFIGIYLFLPLFLIKRRIVIPKRKKKKK